MHVQSGHIERDLETLRMSGELVVPVSRYKFALLLLISVVLSAVGAVMVITAFVTAAHPIDAATMKQFWWGLVDFVFFGVVGFPAMILLKSQRLMLSPTGFTVERRKHGAWRPQYGANWYEVDEFFKSYGNGPWWVGYRLTPQAQDARTRSAPQGTFQSGLEKMGNGGGYLPWYLSSSRRTCLKLMQQAHVEHAS